MEKLLEQARGRRFVMHVNWNVFVKTLTAMLSSCSYQPLLETDWFLHVWMCQFDQAGRMRRSHPEEEGQVTTKGNVGRTTPAVAASERRKSLKLVRRKWKYRCTKEKIQSLFLLLHKLLTSVSSSIEILRVLSCHLFLQDCLLGSARCVLLQCPLHSFSGQAVLKIHARLWNSSFIEVRKQSSHHYISTSLHTTLHLSLSPAVPPAAGTHWSDASEWMINTTSLTRDLWCEGGQQTVKTAVRFDRWVTCSCQLNIQWEIQEEQEIYKQHGFWGIFKWILMKLYCLFYSHI